MASIIRATCLFVMVAAGSVSGVTGGVGVEVDTATLNRLLAAVAADRFELDLGGGNVVTVELQDLQVTGLRPATTSEGRDAILTSVTVVAPQVGLRVPLRPRVVVDVVEDGGASMLELRFEDTGLAVPLMGSINFARLTPPLRFPADNAWVIAGARGDVPLTSRLVRIEMGEQKIRFEFDVDVDAGP